MNFDQISNRNQQTESTSNTRTIYIYVYIFGKSAKFPTNGAHFLFIFIVSLDFSFNLQIIF